MTSSGPIEPAGVGTAPDEAIGQAGRIGHRRPVVVAHPRTCTELSMVLGGEVPVVARQIEMGAVPMARRRPRAVAGTATATAKVRAAPGTRIQAGAPGGVPSRSAPPSTRTRARSRRVRCRCRAGRRGCAPRRWAWKAVGVAFVSPWWRTMQNARPAGDRRTTTSSSSWRLVAPSSIARAAVSAMSSTCRSRWQPPPPSATR